jgi:uncharacterized phage infection (PIP) family protein YhgE
MSFSNALDEKLWSKFLGVLALRQGIRNLKNGVNHAEKDLSREQKAVNRKSISSLEKNYKKVIKDFHKAIGGEKKLADYTIKFAKRLEEDIQAQEDLDDTLPFEGQKKSHAAEIRKEIKTLRENLNHQTQLIADLERVATHLEGRSNKAA